MVSTIVLKDHSQISTPNGTMKLRESIEKPKDEIPTSTTISLNLSTISFSTLENSCENSMKRKKSLSFSHVPTSSSSSSNSPNITCRLRTTSTSSLPSTTTTNPTTTTTTTTTQPKKIPFRSGKWTTQEEAFAHRLIEDFTNGLLEDVEEGSTMRSWLSKQLNCCPMRISKKFVGSQSIGKRMFKKNHQLLASLTKEQQREREEQLQQLKQSFYDIIANENHHSNGNTTTTATTTTTVAMNMNHLKKVSEKTTTLKKDSSVLGYTKKHQNMYTNGYIRTVPIEWYHHNLEKKQRQEELFKKEQREKKTSVGRYKGLRIVTSMNKTTTKHRKRRRIQRSVSDLTPIPEYQKLYPPLKYISSDEEEEEEEEEEDDEEDEEEDETSDTNDTNHETPRKSSPSEKFYIPKFPFLMNSFDSSISPSSSSSLNNHCSMISPSSTIAGMYYRTSSPTAGLSSSTHSSSTTTSIAPSYFSSFSIPPSTGFYVSESDLPFLEACKFLDYRPDDSLSTTTKSLVNETTFTQDELLFLDLHENDTEIKDILDDKVFWKDHKMEDQTKEKEDDEEREEEEKEEGKENIRMTRLRRINNKTKRKSERRKHLNRKDI